MKTCVQGKAIVEKDSDGGVNASNEWVGFVVMAPDGEVRRFRTKKQVAAWLNKWASDNSDPDAVNVMTIEWRGGIIPPQEEAK